LFGGEFQDGAIAVAESLFRATARAPEGRGPWVKALLGRPTPPELEWEDFSHLAEPADLAARLLRGAAEAGAAGVHVLLHGPVGTGKTRLAASVAARAGLALYAVGEADEDGDEPTRASRASALRLAMALTARRRDAALLFDEAEDVLEAAPRQAGDARDNRSKNWLNLLLERSPTPVLWTCNDLHRIDPSILRRFGLLIEVDVPREAAVRARVWARVMEGAGLALPQDAAARLAGRWVAAPALCASAARAARLSRGGEAEVEAALGGYARVPGGGAPRPAYPVRDAAAAFDPDLIACDTDIAALAGRLAAPGAPKEWALLVTCPAGSGRSTVAARLASGLGLPVLRRRSADLAMGAPSEAWRAVAGAFAETRARHAVLVLDGIDGVAAERVVPGAARGALDTLLAELDDARLPVIAVADLPARLDRAALRRFALQVRLRALDPERAALAFRRMLGAEPPGSLPEGLVPGDFAAVGLRRDLLGGGAEAATLRAWVVERAEAGGALPRDVGFRVLRTDGSGVAGGREDRRRSAAAG
jgi:transitional endoplasmic reticulum ATPase